jgi:hypothetical protein
VYGNRTRLALIDNQVPHQSAYTAKTGRPVGIPTPISAFGALCPVRLDDRPKTWYGHEESNPDLYVRSVPSYPLDDARVKLWLAAQASNLEPSESESDALPIAPAASGRG